MDQPNTRKHWTAMCRSVVGIDYTGRWHGNKRINAGQQHNDDQHRIVERWNLDGRSEGPSFRTCGDVVQRRCIVVFQLESLEYLDCCK